MQLKFELNDAGHQNVFLALLGSCVSEQVLLALIWHLKIDDTILAEEINGSTRYGYELAKVYQKTVCEDERFVILDYHQTGRKPVTYGVWLEEKELIALFEINNDVERILLATGYWGGERMPWANKEDGEWQSDVDGACRSGALAHHAVRRIGRCVDEYECLLGRG